MARPDFDEFIPGCIATVFVNKFRLIVGLFHRHNKVMSRQLKLFHSTRVFSTFYLAPWFVIDDKPSNK